MIGLPEIAILVAVGSLFALVGAALIRSIWRDEKLPPDRFWDEEDRHAR